MAKVPKELRAAIDKANKRIKRLAAAGIKSYAAERALSALNQPNFNLGRKPTLSRIEQTKRIVEQFLKAETSTVKGAKAVAKRQAEGFSRYFKEIGLSHVAEDVKAGLSQLYQSGIRLEDLVSTLNYPSEHVMREMGLAAENDALDAFLQRLVDEYTDTLQSRG